MRKKKINVFVIDDDEMYLKTCIHNLGQNKGFSIKTFTSGEALLEAMKSAKVDVMVLDYFLDSEKPGAMSGIEVLKKIKSIDPNIEVIMLSGQEDIDVAINSVKYGAFDYVVKNKSALIRVQNDIKRIHKNKELEMESQNYKKFSKGFIGFLILLVIFLIIYAINPSLLGFDDPTETKKDPDKIEVTE